MQAESAAARSHRNDVLISVSLLADHADASTALMVRSLAERGAWSVGKRERERE